VVNFKRRVYEQALRHLVTLAEDSCSVTLREQRWETVAHAP
jgi:putative (di)nucleoside polyphosphate hydrolase